MIQHFRTLALYNRWANKSLYEAAASLSMAELKSDRGAFFSSVLGTLIHLLVVDLNWIARLRGEQSQLGIAFELNSILYDNLDELGQARNEEDRRLIEFVYGLEEFESGLTYHNSTGEPRTQTYAEILAHLFNHQTHHRGQCHGLIHQINQSAPILDLLAYQLMVAPTDRP